MKKILLMMAVAALVLASCSSDETVAVNQDNAINIRAYQTGLTRATDADLSTSGKTFKVTAFPTGTTSTAYIPEVVFTTDGTTFTSASKYYWKANTPLDFYAWAPSDLSASANHYDGFTITPGATIGSQPDLIYAVSKNWFKDNTPTGTEQVASSGVVLNFRHAESKIVINLQNTNANLKFTVKDVAIGNILNSGTFTWNQCTDGATTPTTADNTDGKNSKYLDGTWNTSSASATAYTVTMESTSSYNIFDGTVAAKGLTSTPANYEMILIPQPLTTEATYSSATSGSSFDGPYISVELMIQNKQDGDAYLTTPASTYVKAMWPLTSITWLPGHKYTYIVDLAGGGYYFTNNDTDIDLDPIINSADEIKFVNCTVDDWIVTAPAGDQNVSN